MATGNSAHWIQCAAQDGIDLNFLYQDKKGIFARLKKLGLPNPLRRYHHSLDEITHETFEIAQFCRLIPHKKGDNRPYRPNITSKEELEQFLEENPGDYIINLVEQGTLTHTGSTVVTKDAVIAELLAGELSGQNLFHGHETPVSAYVSHTRRILYRGPVQPTSKERAIMCAALKHIGWPSHPVEGYFEWFVNVEKGIQFRNYQPPKSAYAQL